MSINGRLIFFKWVEKKKKNDDIELIHRKSILLMECVKARQRLEYYRVSDLSIKNMSIESMSIEDYIINCYSLNDLNEKVKKIFFLYDK